MLDVRSLPTYLSFSMEKSASHPSSPQSQRFQDSVNEIPTGSQTKKLPKYVSVLSVYIVQSS